MARALQLARVAAAAEEVPVGAVLTGADGAVLAEAHNLTKSLPDPTAHAEMLVLREAARLLGNERLTGCTLWVTLEPCPMCAAAIAEARIARMVYAASDPKGGGVEHGPRIFIQVFFLRDENRRTQSGGKKGKAFAADSGSYDGDSFSLKIIR